MKLKNILFFTLLSLMVVACHKDKDDEPEVIPPQEENGPDKEESGQTAEIMITHDIVMPSPLMEIADAYATYSENGETKTEEIQNGKFSHTATYVYEGKEEIDMETKGFDSLTITLKLKDGAHLSEGAKLYEDPDAHFNYSYIIKKQSYQSSESSNGSTSSSGSSKVEGSDGYVIPKEAQEYSFPLDKQEQLFEEQAEKPFYRVSCDRNGTTLHFNLFFCMMPK